MGMAFFQSGIAMNRTPKLWGECLSVVIAWSCLASEDELKLAFDLKG